MTTSLLLTSTFYGNWLPGDPRGFVGRVWERRDGDSEADRRHVHDIPGTPYDQDFPSLEQASADLLRGPAILINLEQAQALLTQFQETAGHRGWKLCAVAIMANHVHIVVQVEGKVDPTKVLGDFKAYGSRALNRRWGKPKSDTWWTSKGSKRRLPDEDALRAAIRYVTNHDNPLVLWAHPDFEDWVKGIKWSGVA
jgi:REP element-mobilizing transposase RayT